MQMLFALIQKSSAVDIVYWIIPVVATASSIAGLIWTIWLVQAFRRDLKRDRGGLCMKCGYDLRHSTERCPECGEPIRHRKFQSH